MTLGDAIVILMFGLFASCVTIYLAIENHGLHVKLDSMQAQLDSVIDVQNSDDTGLEDVWEAITDLQREVRE